MSSLNPHAAPFEPWNIAQTSNNQLYQNNQNATSYPPSYHQNTYDSYVPKLQQQMREAIDSLDSFSSPFVIHSNKKDKIIRYITLTSVPKENTKIGKKQNTQPKSIYKSNNCDENVIDVLIRGYCRNVKIKRIPFDLFSLFAKYYGYKNNKAIGTTRNAHGFTVADFSTEKTTNIIYYTPRTQIRFGSKIVATATNIKLPSHIIDHYNKFQTTPKINKYSRYNIVFMKYIYVSIKYDCIIFNDEFALGLILPDSDKPDYSASAVYSNKYGLLVCTTNGLKCFSLKTWKWITIKESSIYFDANEICLLKRENKLFIYRWNHYNNPKAQYSLYDFKTSKFQHIPNSIILQYPHPIIVCDEGVNPKIFVVVRNGKRNVNGKILYFDLKKFQWIDTTFQNGPIKDIWFENDKNIINAICDGKKNKTIWCTLDLKHGIDKWKQVFSNCIFCEWGKIFKL